MNHYLTTYAITLLFLALVAGCAAGETNLRSAQEREMSTQSQRESTRTKQPGRSNEPPNITYRPGA